MPINLPFIPFDEFPLPDEMEHIIIISLAVLSEFITFATFLDEHGSISENSEWFLV